MAQEILHTYKLEDEQIELIKQLRDEVSNIKECIARYTIQCLMFAGAALGLIVHELKNTDGIVLATVPTLFLLRAVSRTAIHKLGTINRNLGYELHLQRTRRLPPNKHVPPESYVALGWEEAMRAWRIVQATVYKNVCFEANERFQWRAYVGAGYRRPADPRSKLSTGAGYHWYDVVSLVAQADPRAKYHPGNYARKMLDIVHWSMLACVFVQIFALVLDRQSPASLHVLGMHMSTSWLVGPVMLGSAVFVGYAWRRDSVRLRQLEGGVLSIHSCAIIWQAVVVAHYRALVTWRNLRTGTLVRPDVFSGYTYNLALQARSLATDVFKIHSWIACEREERIPVSGRSRTWQIRAATGDSRSAGVRDFSKDGRGLALEVQSNKDVVFGRIFVQAGNIQIRGVCRHITGSEPSIVIGIRVDDDTSAALLTAMASDAGARSASQPEA